MKTVLKYGAVVAMAGAVALATASPSQARHGRNAAAIGGLVAGTVIGAAIANSSNSYYGPGYYAEPGYAPGYAYEPAYSYEPAPTYYYSSGRRYQGSEPSCATEGTGGRIDYSAC